MKDLNFPLMEPCKRHITLKREIHWLHTLKRFYHFAHEKHANFSMIHVT